MRITTTAISLKHKAAKKLAIEFKILNAARKGP